MSVVVPFILQPKYCICMAPWISHSQFNIAGPMVVKPHLTGSDRFCVYHVCWVVVPVTDHSYAV